MGLASWLLVVAREFWKEEVGDGSNFETNGERHNSPALSVCCTNRVLLAKCWRKEYEPKPDDIDARGLVRCGNQWDPNQ